MMSRISSSGQSRLRLVAYFFLALAGLIGFRLFYLQIIKSSYYKSQAAESHDLSRQIFPRRGTIYFRDARTGERSVAAIDKEYYVLFANPTKIPFSEVSIIGEQLTTILGITDTEEKRALLDKLTRRSTYQVLAKKISEEMKLQIDTLEIKEGIYTRPQPYRFYPEGRLAAPVLGFGARKDESKPITGEYGIEGYWNQILTGKAGLIRGEKSYGGSWITLAGRTIVPAEDGADVVLTIDRNLEYEACERLRKGFEEYKAKSAALIIMNPKTGAILAMCSFPDFDPNSYGQVSSTAAYNNTTIFTPYEPGSVFKPITMSVALDLNLLDPHTPVPADRLAVFFPTPGYRIGNADGAIFKPPQDATSVLIYSINTGMTWVIDLIGLDRFGEYLEKFGFAQKTDITLDVEAAGQTDNITGKNRKKVDMYGASFGQSIFVTPLQLAVAYSALANGGMIVRPYVVESVRYGNGEVQKTEVEVIGQVISSRTSALINGMLVATMNSRGYKNNVYLKGYEVAAKTGTAQIFEKNKKKLDENGREIHNHTVTGFAPAKDPQIVLVVKYEEPSPEIKYAEGTAGPVFRDVMGIALKYLGIQEAK